MMPRRVQGTRPRVQGVVSNVPRCTVDGIKSANIKAAAGTVGSQKHKNNVAKRTVAGLDAHRHTINCRVLKQQ